LILMACWTTTKTQLKMSANMQWV